MNANLAYAAHALVCIALASCAVDDTLPAQPEAYTPSDFELVREYFDLHDTAEPGTLRVDVDSGSARQLGWHLTDRTGASLRVDTVSVRSIAVNGYTTLHNFAMLFELPGRIPHTITDRRQFRMARLAPDISLSFSGRSLEAQSLVLILEITGYDEARGRLSGRFATRMGTFRGFVLGVPFWDDFIIVTGSFTELPIR